MRFASQGRIRSWDLPPDQVPLSLRLVNLQRVKPSNLEGPSSRHLENALYPDKELRVSVPSTAHTHRFSLEVIHSHFEGTFGSRKVDSLYVWDNPRYHVTFRAPAPVHAAQGHQSRYCGASTMGSGRLI
jgi:hypothetical protein